MLRLTGTVKLQVVLSGAATASRVTVSYMDFTASATTGGTQLSVTNGATPVDICDAPAASTTRQIDHVRMVVLAAMTATFSVNDGTARDWIKVTLALGDVFDWSHSGGAKVLDSGGNIKQVIGGAVSATTLAVSGDSILTGDLAINGGDLTTTATTFNLLATPTTLNIGAGASVALNIGHASAAAAFPGGISIPTGKNITGTGTAIITGFAGITLAGPITGVGHEINNVVIGAVSPGAGSFSTITANTSFVLTAASPLLISKDTTAYSAGVTGAALRLQGLDSTSANSNLATIQSLATAGQYSDIVFSFANAGSIGEGFRIIGSGANGTIQAKGLSGTGTRAVVVDANGVMSAP